MNRPDISIIIVNYNTRHLLYECLESIQNSIDLSYEVIVADNHSTDDSFTVCSGFSDDPRFILLPLDDNYGFAKANNLAAEHASGKVFHFLNPDTRVAPSLNADYQKVMEQPDAVYVNPLFNRDGSLENEKMPIPVLSNIIRWQLRSRKAHYWFKGASVILSRPVFSGIGKWSEDYFMYAEDIDLFYKIWQSGIDVRMLSAPIFHFGGGSSRNEWDILQREVIIQKSLRKFYTKYYSSAEYVKVKLYYILHKLFRHPSQVPLEIRSWVGSRQ